MNEVDEQEEVPAPWQRAPSFNPQSQVPETGHKKAGPLGVAQMGLTLRSMALCLLPALTCSATMSCLPAQLGMAYLVLLFFKPLRSQAGLQQAEILRLRIGGSRGPENYRVRASNSCHPSLSNCSHSNNSPVQQSPSAAGTQSKTYPVGAPQCKQY